MNRSEVGRLGYKAAQKGIEKWLVRRKTAAIARWREKEKRCPHCGKIIPFEKRCNTFCGHLCAASFNNLGVRRHGNDPHSIVKCAACGAELANRRVTHGLAFCNTRCKGDFYYRAYIARWQAGNETGAKKGGLSSHVKRYLIEKYGNQCAQCGWSRVNPYTGKAPLDIHHIDGNASDNAESNLILLCPNCHALTSTYKGLNKGRGRAGRRVAGEVKA